MIKDILGNGVIEYGVRREDAHIPIVAMSTVDCTAQSKGRHATVSTVCTE
jgi:hypothetical protein